MTLPALSLVLSLQLATTPLDAPLRQPRAEALVRKRAPIVAAVGGGLMMVGLGLWFVGANQSADVNRAMDPDKRLVAETNAAHNTVGGAALVVVGACVLGFAGVMWQSLGGRASAGIAPLPGGGAVVVSGALR